MSGALMDKMMVYHSVTKRAARSEVLMEWHWGAHWETLRVLPKVLHWELPMGVMMVQPTEFLKGPHWELLMGADSVTPRALLRELMMGVQ